MKNVDENEEVEPLQQIAALSTEATPPAALEQAVLLRLRSERLLASSRPRSRALLAAALLAGLAVGLAGGLYFGDRPGVQEAGEESDERGPLFAFFLWQGDSYRPAPPAAVDARVTRYSRWAADLRGQGRAASGAKLSDDAGFVLLPGAERLSPSVTATPPSTSLGQLAGYFVVEAANLEEARSIAATCPHLEYGGAIEVRRIEG